MAWASVTTEELDEQDNGGAGQFDQGSIRLLNPAEGVHIYVTRTDMTPSDDWFVRIYASIDQAKMPDLPRRTWRMSATQLEKDCSISGPMFSYYVEIGNADPNPTDVVIGDVEHRKDGINL